MAPHLLGDRIGGPSSCLQLEGLCHKEGCSHRISLSKPFQPSGHQMCPLIGDLTPAWPLTQPHPHRKGREEPWRCPVLTLVFPLPRPACSLPSWVRLIPRAS